MKASDMKRAEKLAARMGDFEKLDIGECADGTAVIAGRYRRGRPTMIYSAIASFALAKEITLTAIGLMKEDRLPDVIRFNPRQA